MVWNIWIYTSRHFLSMFRNMVDSTYYYCCFISFGSNIRRCFWSIMLEERNHSGYIVINRTCELCNNTQKEIGDTESARFFRLLSTTNSQHEYQCISYISPGVSRVNTVGALSCDLSLTFLCTHVHRSAIDNHSTVDYAIDNRLSDNASFELVVPLRIWIQSAEYRRFGIASVFHKIQKEWDVVVVDILTCKPFIYDQDIGSSVYLP